MKNRHLKYLAASVVLFWLGLCCTGCLDAILPKKRVGGPTSGPGPAEQQKPATESEADRLREADRANREGRHAEALGKYEAFLKGFPDSAKADYVLITIGQLRETTGLQEKAIMAYRDLLKKYPNSKFANEAGFRLASLYLETGKPDAAAETASKMLAKTSKADDKARLRIILGRAYLAQGHRGQALDVLRKALRETSDPTDKIEAQRTAKAVVAAMTVEELTQAQSEVGQDFPGGYISYTLAYRLYQDGRDKEAKSQLDDYFQQFPRHELINEARVLRQSIQDKEAPPALTWTETLEKSPRKPTSSSQEKSADSESTASKEKPAESGIEPASGPYRTMDIACILPLSDAKQATYGKQVLKGLQIAFKNYKAITKGFKSNLVVLDSKGNSEQASTLVQQAADHSNVLAVVGPLLSKEAAAAAPKAQRLELPLITITQKEDITQAGGHVFRLFLTPKAQADAVAKHAVQVLGFKRLAILHPNEPYGQEMRDYFRNEAKKYGAEIINVVGYNPKASEYSAEIQKLTGVGRAVKKVSIGHKAEVNFDAVFLPDNTKAVAMITPQFAYHDITTVRFLGTSLWHTSGLIPAAGRYIQKCVIPTAFFADSNRPEVKRFMDYWKADSKEDGGEEPGQFEAYGYDAGMLLLTLMDKGHVSSRADLVAALNKLGAFPGVTGRFSFTSNREYKVDPALITVSGSEFKLIQ